MNSKRWALIVTNAESVVEYTSSVKLGMTRREATDEARRVLMCDTNARCHILELASTLTAALEIKEACIPGFHASA